MRTYYAIFHPESTKYLEFNKDNKCLGLKYLRSTLHFYHEDSEQLISLLQLAYSRPRFNGESDDSRKCKPYKDVPIFDESFCPDYNSLRLVKYSLNIRSIQFSSSAKTYTIIETSKLPPFKEVHLHFLMDQESDQNRLYTNLKLITHLTDRNEIIQYYNINSNKYKIETATRSQTSSIDFIDMDQLMPNFCRYDEKFITSSQLLNKKSSCLCVEELRLIGD